MVQVIQHRLRRPWSAEAGLTQVGGLRSMPVGHGGYKVKLKSLRMF